MNAMPRFDPPGLRIEPSHIPPNPNWRCAFCGQPFQQGAVLMLFCGTEYVEMACAACPALREVER
jgi:hypothetical protein